MNLRNPFLPFFTAALLASTTAANAADTPTAKGWLLVTNKADQTLSIVDPTTNQQVTTISGGRQIPATNSRLRPMASAPSSRSTATPAWASRALTDSSFAW